MIKVFLFISPFLLFSQNLVSQCTGFDHGQWTTDRINTLDGSVVTSDPNSVTISGANDGNGNSEVNYCFIVPVTGDVSLNWVYTSSNGAAGWDVMGTMIDGVFTQLTDGTVATDNGNVNQSGRATSVNVLAGSEFCLSQRSHDGRFGGATTVFSDLTYSCVPPEPVPTMGEWGLASLSLLLLIFGVNTIKEKIINHGNQYIKSTN